MSKELGVGGGLILDDDDDDDAKNRNKERDKHYFKDMCINDGNVFFEGKSIV